MHATDYQTASSVAQAINQAKGPGTATAVDGRSARGIDSRARSMRAASTLARRAESWHVATRRSGRG